MFLPFRRKALRPKELTFKTRVCRFWEWYGQAAPRFYQTIQEGQCVSLAEEVSSKVDELIPGFAWVFGPGADGKGHSFTLSGEVEDALEEELKGSASGRLLGGAFGTKNAYIDLLLFDGPTSLEIVHQVLCGRNLPEGTTVNYFAKEKRGHRIVL